MLACATKRYYIHTRYCKDLYKIITFVYTLKLFVTRLKRCNKGICDVESSNIDMALLTRPNFKAVVFSPTPTPGYTSLPKNCHTAWEF